MTPSLQWLFMGSHSPRQGYSILPKMYMLYHEEPAMDTVVVLEVDKNHHTFWELRAKMAREAERITNAAAAAAAPPPSPLASSASSS